RLGQVRDQLRDIVTEEGHFVDELRGVGVHVEPRFRKEYDPDRLALAFPQLAACIRPAVDVNQMEACVAAGMVTERELEREGVLFRTLHSRALVVKKIPRSHVAGSTLCECTWLRLPVNVVSERLRTRNRAHLDGCSQVLLVFATALGTPILHSNLRRASGRLS